MGFVFQEPKMLWMLVFVPACAVFFVYASRRRREAVRVFSAAGGKGAHRFLWRRDVQAGTICVAVLGLVLALARPGWNPMKEKVKRESRDVIFVLDVSRSMLARDLKPDRLEYAKAVVKACASKLDENQRLALVAFAGSSAIQCPLARDRKFFESALDNVGPEVVAQGGTRIGDALRKVSEKLLTPAMYGFQDVILITDGGDQESDPDGGALALNEMGASLMIVGLGSEGTGARIPDAGPGESAGSYLIHEGQEVWTKLETAGLERILEGVDPGRGLYHKGSAAEAGEKYLRFTEFLEKRQVEVELAERYEEGFPWFVGFSFVALLVGLLFRIPPKRGAGVATVVLVGMFGEARAGGISSIRHGVLNFEIERDSYAAVSGSEEKEEDSDPPEAIFNFGNSLMELGDFSGAMTRFEEAATVGRSEVLRRKCLFNLGHCAFRIAADQESLAGAMPPPEDGEGADEDGADVGGTLEIARSYFERSAEYFRAAYRMDRSYLGAAQNLEIARIRAEKIREALEKNGKPGDQSGDEGDEGEGEQPDGEEGDEGEEGDAEESDPGEDFEEGESEDGDPTDLGRSQTSLTDLNNQALPPPALTPEDILNEELMNNETRDKSSGRKGKAVERDW